jgi:iron complex outermembrane receptor protein
MHHALLATSALVSIALAAPAFAQEPTAEDVGGIDEIVVTAQKKEESLQDAALAIDAIQGAGLIQAGISQARDLTKLVPSLTIGNGGGVNASLFLRGVGNRTNNSYADSAIAVSYDGVYVSRAAAVNGAAFYDLERVEVLKGPQGILYGRNATGGALNVVPAKPRLGELSGGFTASYGSYETLNTEGFVNVPLGDATAMRLAATRQSQDGFNRDGTDDRDVIGARAQLLFAPGDAWSIRLGFDYTKLGGRGPGGHYLGNFTPGPSGYTYTPASFDLYEGLGTAAANAYRTSLLGAPGFGFLTALNSPTYIDIELWGINAEIKGDLGFAELTVIPAYRKDSGSVAFNGPAFNTAININDNSQFSLEARLAGSVGKVDYLVGGFYLDDKAAQNNVFNQEFVMPIQNYDHQTKSWAIFGQVSFNINDRLRLIGGARYTHDRKTMNGIINNFITFCGGLPPANITPPASFANGCAAASPALVGGMAGDCSRPTLD